MSDADLHELLDHACSDPMTGWSRVRWNQHIDAPELAPVDLPQPREPAPIWTAPGSWSDWRLIGSSADGSRLFLGPTP